MKKSAQCFPRKDEKQRKKKLLKKVDLQGNQMPPLNTVTNVSAVIFSLSQPDKCRILLFFEEEEEEEGIFGY